MTPFNIPPGSVKNANNRATGVQIAIAYYFFVCLYD